MRESIVTVQRQFSDPTAEYPLRRYSIQYFFITSRTMLTATTGSFVPGATFSGCHTLSVRPKKTYVKIQALPELSGTYSLRSLCL